MKKQCIIFALGAMLMASCADEFDRNFEVPRPGNSEAYAYLSDYGPLKEYVSNPDFKLGVGTDAADYAKQGLTYVVTNANFTETVAGNAMKMGSVVDDKGGMNFATVESYVAEAAQAGMNVYGHTLAWHAQQPVKWLNTLLADKIDPNYTPEQQWEEFEEAVTCIKVISDDMVEAAWDTQFWLVVDKPFSAGDSWEVSMRVRADKAASAGTQTHKEPGGYIHWAGIGTVNFTTEWTTYEASGTIPAEGDGGWSFAFNLNDFAEANTYYFDDISLKINGVEVIVNGNCDDPNGTANFVAKEMRGGIVPARIVDKITVKKLVNKPSTVEKRVDRTCIQVITDDMVSDPWDSQFWIVINGATFNPGDSYEVSMNVRADYEATSGTQIHKAPSDYLHWDGIGTVPFTTEWTTYTKSGTIPNEGAGGYSIAFNLNDFTSANTYYFDDISFKLNGVEMISNGNCDDPEGTANFVSKEMRGNLVPSRIVDHYTEWVVSAGTIPLTDEEKKDTLIWAMDKWINSMMNACSDDAGNVLVKAWDVVNEPISGGNPDGEGVYALQHGSEDNTNDFFWQDYLGDIDYVRTAVRLARQYGGNDQKLFVNDYNLESDWDNNQKLKSLIKWIERWEADGVTKIDGIGTQMHISCYADPNTQASKKTAIENMFKLMAATGKLVRVSELDMGYVDADGNTVMTADMTEEQHHQMAEHYKYVIQKYMEIIPAAQQWGITQWCATDSPAGSGWRAGEPVGLWDQNYYRKHTYAGFADGLAGK